MTMAQPASTRLDGGKEAPAVYALLSMDDRKLLLAQRDIRTLEPVTDVIGRETDLDGALGYLRFEDRLWPVYALAGDLSVLGEIPASRRICALVNRPGGYFAIVCDQFDLVSGRGLRFQPTPACMVTPTSAIDALARHDNEIVLSCSVPGLARILHIEDNGNTPNGY